MYSLQTYWLFSQNKCVRCPFGACGCIGESLSLLLVGRSGSFVQGINVHLDVIDSDSLGQRCDMIQVGDSLVVPTGYMFCLPVR